MTSSVDNDKRRFLTTAASVVVGGAGAVAAAVPFVTYMLPSAQAQAAGAPVAVDISKLVLGQLLTIEWRGKPVWILRRTQEVLDYLPTLNDELRDPDSTVDQQPDYAKNKSRSLRDEVMVLVGVCTHLGCSPKLVIKQDAEKFNLNPDEWNGGFFCPCHGSKFDLAGRVYKGVPAPTNLEVPPYYFQGDNRIVIGEDPQGAA